MTAPKRRTAGLGSTSLSQEIRLGRESKIGGETFGEDEIEHSVVLERQWTVCDAAMSSNGGLERRHLTLKVRVRHRREVIVPTCRVLFSSNGHRIRLVGPTQTKEVTTFFHHAFERGESGRFRWRIGQRFPDEEVIDPAAVVARLIAMITDGVSQFFYPLAWVHISSILEQMTVKDKQKALDAIADEISRCKICKRDKVGLPVPGEGDPNATVMFVGEAPGKREAESGRPFIGPSGKLLRSSITKIGLREQDVFITSAVKYLPKHVTPTPEEIAHGRAHLRAQIDVIRPKIIVLLGRVATESVLERKVAISKEHGSLVQQDGRTYLIAYHPAAALRYPPARKFFEQDMITLKKYLSSR